MAAAKGTALEAYIVVSLLSGVRTEEARALRWDHVVATDLSLSCRLALR
jgi:hypothetical protein